MTDELAALSGTDVTRQARLEGHEIVLRDLESGAEVIILNRPPSGPIYDLYWAHNGEDLAATVELGSSDAARQTAKYEILLWSNKVGHWRQLFRAGRFIQHLAW